MPGSRTAEIQNNAVYRSSRLYVTNDGWYFDSREGVQFGPFECRAEAECGLAVYIAQHLHEFPESDHLIDDAAGAQDGLVHMVQEVLEVLELFRDFGPRAARNWIKCRLDDLRTNAAESAEMAGRVRVLEFSLNHSEQTFSFEVFLKHRAG